MDLNTQKLCRLCLQTSDDVVNIWKSFQDSTIASILAKHFWFEVHKNDGLTESICQICWIHTKTFHEFYKKVEQFQKCFWDSVGKASADIDPKEAVLEPDLNIVKCEETSEEIELTLEDIDLQIIKEDTSGKDYTLDNICDESDNSQTLDHEDQCFNKEPKNEDIVDNHSRPLNIERKHYNSLSRSEKEQQNAQIRELFNMKCEICSNVEFESLLKAKQHYRKVHEISGYITCCGRKFNKLTYVAKHIRSHINPDAYQCDQCGKSFTTKYSLNNHIAYHVPLDSRAFKCSSCSTSCPTAALLRMHVKQKHTSKNGEKFVCGECNKIFRSSLLLSNHIRGVHKFPLDYVCEVCARSFKSKNSLRNHIDFEHSITPPSKVECNICGVWLKHEQSLRKHLGRHQNSKAFNCPICDKEVQNKSALGNHIRYAHGEKNHQCTLCDKAFNRAKNLKEHLASHTGEDLYNCSYCEKKFKSSANMYNHRKNVHLAEWNRDFPQRIRLTNKSKKEKEV